MKVCTRCKVEKELTEFGKNKAIKDGYRFQCKACRNEQLRTGKPNTGRFQKGDKRPEHSLRMKAKYEEGKSPIKPFPKGNIPWNKGEFTTGKKRSRRFKHWATLVKQRDGECKKCGAKENLHAHHIFPWKDNEENRFELDNGMTLCNSCHAKEEGFQKGHSDVANNKGRKLSEEHKEKLRKAKIGYIPWNKGTKMSEDHRKNLSESLKGRSVWNKGLKHGNRKS